MYFMFWKYFLKQGRIGWLRVRWLMSLLFDSNLFQQLSLLLWSYTLRKKKSTQWHITVAIVEIHDNDKGFSNNYKKKRWNDMQQYLLNTQSTHGYNSATLFIAWSLPTVLNCMSYWILCTIQLFVRLALKSPCNQLNLRSRKKLIFLLQWAHPGPKLTTGILLGGLNVQFRQVALRKQLKNFNGSKVLFYKNLMIYL